MRTISLLTLLLFTSYAQAIAVFPLTDTSQGYISGSDLVSVEPVSSSKGLIWGNGIEPTNSTLFDVQGGNRIWYVDAQASDGGDGTVGSPLNNFSTLLGYFDGTNFVAGTRGFVGGDHIWVRGVFDFANHVNGTKNYDMQFRRENQLGTVSNPTVIRAWRGFTAAFKGDLTARTFIETKVTNLAGNDRLTIVNLEMYDNLGVPILNDDTMTHIDVVSSNIHDIYVDGSVAGAANKGAMSLKLSLAGLIRNVYNCRLVDTDLALAGGRVIGNNNVSAIRLQGTNVAIGGGEANIYLNEVSGASHLVGEKHTGTATVNIYENIGTDISGYAYYNRQTGDSSFHHNVIVGAQGAVYLVRETEYDARNVSVYKNTLVDVNHLIGASHQEINISVLNQRDNIISTPSQTNETLWFAYSSEGFNLSGVTSSHNLFNTNNASNFMFHINNIRTFAQAMSDLSDTTSIMADPLFVNRAGGDYTLANGSPAINAASDGGNIGAFESTLPITTFLGGIDFDGLTNNQSVTSLVDFYGTYGNSYGMSGDTAIKRAGKTSSANMSIQAGTTGRPGDGTPAGNGDFGFIQSLADRGHEVTQGEEFWLAFWLYVPSDFSFDTGVNGLKFIRMSYPGYGPELDTYLAEASEFGGSVDDNGGWILANESYPQLISNTHKQTQSVLVKGQWNFICKYTKASSNQADSIERLWVNDAFTYEHVGGTSTVTTTWVDQNGAEQSTVWAPSAGSGNKWATLNVAEQISSFYLFTYWNNNAPKDQSLNIQEVVYHKSPVGLSIDSRGNPYIASEQVQ